jgi:hypothetical protein
MRNPNIKVLSLVSVGAGKIPTMITYRTWPVNKNRAFRIFSKVFQESGFSGIGFFRTRGFPTGRPFLEFGKALTSLSGRIGGIILFTSTWHCSDQCH